MHIQTETETEIELLPLKDLIAARTSFGRLLGAARNAHNLFFLRARLFCVAEVFFCSFFSSHRTSPEWHGELGNLGLIDSMSRPL